MPRNRERLSGHSASGAARAANRMIAAVMKRVVAARTGDEVRQPHPAVGDQGHDADEGDRRQVGDRDRQERQHLVAGRPLEAHDPLDGVAGQAPRPSATPRAGRRGRGGSRARRSGPGRRRRSRRLSRRLIRPVPTRAGQVDVLEAGGPALEPADRVPAVGQGIADRVVDDRSRGRRPRASARRPSADRPAARGSQPAPAPGRLRRRRSSSTTSSGSVGPSSAIPPSATTRPASRITTDALTRSTSSSRCDERMTCMPRSAPTCWIRASMSSRWDGSSPLVGSSSSSSSGSWTMAWASLTRWRWPVLMVPTGRNRSSPRPTSHRASLAREVASRRGRPCSSARWRTTSWAATSGGRASCSGA